MNTGFTADAAAAVVKSHGHYAAVDLLRNGVAINGEPILLDEDNGAEVRVDGGQMVRRTFTGRLVDPLAYMPVTPTSLLSPFLTEIQVWSGVYLPDGRLIRWSVFVGGIEDPKVSDVDGDLALTIAASDRAQSISERRLPRPYAIVGGTTTVTDGIQGLISSVRPGITFSITSPTTNPLLPAMVIDELEDPMQHAQDMAASYGLECFFSSSGVCVIRPVPDPNNQPVVWTFAEGENAIITGVDAVLTAKNSYSHAIVTGQSVDGSAPVRSDTYDTDSDSPTWYQGNFGDRPVKLASDMITTQDQADAAGVALLNRKKGAVQNVSLTHVPLTALDEFDVVKITRQRVGIDAAFTLESFSIPLHPGGEMNPTCRSRRV